MVKKTVLMRPVRLARKALWRLIEGITDASDGTRYIWVVRLLFKLDAPLRNHIVRGIHAERAKQ